MYWAHEGQELKEHLINTRLYAAEEGKAIGMETIASLCPELHDSGKFSEVFQEYIKQEDSIKKGSVNHSSAGAEILTKRYENCENGFLELMTEMIVYAISAHLAYMTALTKMEMIILKKDYRQLMRMN